MTTKDFDRLLEVLYPKHIRSTTILLYRSNIGFNRDFTKSSLTTVEEWTSVLNLAAKFQFESIKNLAITHLSTIASPIDKIVLGRKHTIVGWLGDSFKSVCERKEPLEMLEMKRLDEEDLLKMINMWISRPSGKISKEDVSRIFDLGKHRPPIQESSVKGAVMEEELKPKKKAPPFTKVEYKKLREGKRKAVREYQEQLEEYLGGRGQDVPAWVGGEIQKDTVWPWDGEI